MKCDNCKQEIECCRNCGMPFEKDSQILCMFGGEHLCGIECLFEEFEAKGDGCYATSIGDEND